MKTLTLLPSVLRAVITLLRVEWQLRHLMRSPEFRALLAETPPDPPTPLLEAIDKQRRERWIDEIEAQLSESRGTHD